MPSLLNLRKFVAPEIIFGVGARTLAGRYAQQFSASKVLVVTDQGVIAAGWLADVQQSLESAGFPIMYFRTSLLIPVPPKLWKERTCIEGRAVMSLLPLAAAAQWIAPKGSALSVQIMNISLNLRGWIKSRCRSRL